MRNNPIILQAEEVFVRLYYLVAKSEVLWGAAPVHAPELRRWGKLRPRSEWIVRHSYKAQIDPAAPATSLLATNGVRVIYDVPPMHPGQIYSTSL